MGTQFPSQKEHSPQFSAHVCCGQTAGWIKIPLGTEVDVGTCDIILDGDPASRKRHSPKISAHVCCGQTARWIKMPLGTEVGFGLDVIVLDGDPAPLKWGTAPHFSAHVCCCLTAAWIKMQKREQLSRNWQNIHVWQEIAVAWSNRCVRMSTNGPRVLK